jgi:hypothetical protein
MATNNFTIEFWLNITATYTSEFLYFIRNTDTIGSSTWYLYLLNNLNTQAGGGTVNNTLISTALPLNSWAHFAYTKSGNNLITWLNGNMISTVTNSNMNNLFNLGRNLKLVIGRGLNGNFNQIRISNYTRYTSTFTPPTNLSPLQNEAVIFFMGNSGYDHINYIQPVLTNITINSNPFAPQLTLIGPESVYLSLNATYTEQGAQAVNYLGTTIPYTITGSVISTASNATYQLIYTVSDSFGTISVTRNVIVSDNPASNSYCWVDAQNSSNYIINASNNIQQIISTNNNIIFSNLVGTPKLTRAINNKNAFDFTMGAGIFSQNVANSVDLTIAVVAKFSSSIGAWGLLWGHMSNIGNTHDIYICLREQIGYIALQSGGYTGPNPYSEPGNQKFYLSNLYNKTVIFIGTLSNNATQRYLQMTDVSTNTTVSTSYTNNRTLISNIIPIYLGTSEVNEHSLAYIGECIYWQRVLPQSEITTIQNYLYNKWS